MSDWTELKTLQDVAKAQADGWEIEKGYGTDSAWEEWVGAAWDRGLLYRGRPKAERKVVRVREAVVMYSDSGSFIVPMTQERFDTHTSAFWVKGSEWREVEYE